MRFRAGDMLLPRADVKYGIAVWDDDMSVAIGHIAEGDWAIAVSDQDDYGWVRVFTREGISGIVHRTNLKAVSEDAILNKQSLKIT